jgi:hypothetical protein
MFPSGDIEQKLLLRYVGDFIVQRFDAHVPHILAADPHRAAGHVVKWTRSFASVDLPLPDLPPAQ